MLMNAILNKMGQGREIPFTNEGRYALGGGDLNAYPAADGK